MSFSNKNCSRILLNNFSGKLASFVDKNVVYLRQRDQLLFNEQQE